MDEPEHSANDSRCRAKLLAALAGLHFFIASTLAISPEALRSLQQMQVADGYEAAVVASEPEIRQPISSTFDERGRLWVIQYLQYPKPAGLTPVKVDQYLRTKYDRVPEPPPRGVKGADRITICEDTDGDGRLDKFKDFVAGLNLCSGMAIGYGGVFVANPPYLLFYPDRNHDDVPDGDPEVLLSGFGIEDAHALANSLTWGPDGWLYGAQGSTVTANIRGIEFQQGIWRYHPVTHEFELFAEGGGNTWGVDFDEHGELIAGTNWEEKMLHQVQGAYYLKSFAKHGELHNPHAYGYFGHVPYTGYRGAHLSVGGVVYQGGAFPAALRNTYISANTLDHAIYWHSLIPAKSSFNASFGGALLKTDEENFRPVDCEVGPDGALYVADWCDKRASHVDPLDTWDRSNGRIYRIQSKGVKKNPPINLTTLPSDKLIDLLTNSNEWYVRQSRRILAERQDKSTYTRLRSQITGANPRLALESLWALYASGGFTDQLASELLSHPSEHVRAWTIRLLGDKREVAPSIQAKLVEVAAGDTSPVVRRQLACTAKRLTDGGAWPIIDQLLRHDEDAGDPQIPLLVWWAIESKAVLQRNEVAKIFTVPTTFQHALVREHLLERLARRYAAEATDEGFAMCAKLLAAAPSPAESDILLKGMDLGLVGQRFGKVPTPLKRWMSQTWSRPKAISPVVMRVSLRLGEPNAREAVVAAVNDLNQPEADRVAILEIIGQSASPGFVIRLLNVYRETPSEKLRQAAVAALQHYPDPLIAVALIETYPTLSRDLQTQVRTALCSRPFWASLLVGAVETDRFPAKDVTLDQVRQMATLKDDKLARRIEKLWGKFRSDSPEEKRSFINQVKLVLKPAGVTGRDPAGDPAAGKLVFTQTCGICHKLFGEGAAVGPDLTSAERGNIDVLLANIVTPSAYIRPEFVNYNAETKDGQSLGGLLVEANSAAVTLLDRNNQRHVLPRDQLATLRESELSLMPEGMLEAMKPQQLMDLFSYLQSTGPPFEKSGVK